MKTATATFRNGRLELTSEVDWPDGIELEVKPLERLVEDDIGAARGSSGEEETEADELAERPWRGVFVPRRPRNVVFSDNLSVKSGPLPKRKPSLNMSWHRVEADHE